MEEDIRRPKRVLNCITAPAAALVSQSITPPPHSATTGSSSCERSKQTAANHAVKRKIMYSGLLAEKGNDIYTDESII